MAEILGIIALLIAFGAIWLASEAMRKVDIKNEEFIKAHVKELNRAITENRDAIVGFASRLQGLDEHMKSLDEKQNEAGKALPGMDQEIRKMRSELSELDRSIPPRLHSH